MATGGQWHLSGYSYGGLLAHQLASNWLVKGRSIADVTLIEPSLPRRLRPLREQWRLRLRDLLQLCGVRAGAARLALWGPEPNVPLPLASKPDVHSRWEMISEHYRQNIETARLRPLGIRVTLVGSDRYHSRFADAWQKIEGAQLEQCVLPGAEDHLSCFREPHAGRWLGFLDERYRQYHSSGAEPIGSGSADGTR